MEDSGTLSFVMQWNCTWEIPVDHRGQLEIRP